MPVDRLSTNSLGKRKVGGKQEVAETKDGYHALWCPSFFDANSEPSCFSIWKQLTWHESATEIRQLEVMFLERGPTHGWRPSLFRAFACERGVNLQFSCMYAPAGNGVAERCHHTVKRITARIDTMLHRKTMNHPWLRPLTGSTHTN